VLHYRGVSPVRTGLLSEETLTGEAGKIEALKGWKLYEYSGFAIS